MTPDPDDLRRLRAVVEAALRPALDDLVATLVRIDADLRPAAEALVDAASDGKRVRPVLLLVGHELAGGGDSADVLGPAIALELVHTCALVHDDVIDRATTRRGRPTVHARFAADHRDAPGRRGDADAVGRAAAILIGDVALVAADAHFAAARVAPAALGRAMERFTLMRIEVMAGQFLDVDAAARGRGDIARAVTVATLKSGRYSVARPLELGALLADADPAIVTALGRYGDAVGLAFQLRDDVLGLTGDPAVTGKPVGADLVEGKRTLLVAEALARLDAHDRDRLDRGLGDDRADAEEVDALVGLVVGSGAVEAVEARIRDELATARDAVASLPETARARLDALASALTARDR